MDIRVTLSKIVTLIYRTRIVNNLENDDLIRTILGTIKTDSPEFSFGSSSIPKSLKELSVELLEDKDPIPKEVLLPRLSILLENDQKLLATMKESVDTDYDDASNKRIIAALIKHLYNYHKEHQATEIISKVAYDLKFNRSKIPNFAAYLQDTMARLEPFTTLQTTLKDPAVVNEIDFENQDSVTTVFEEVKNVNSDNGVYRLGWRGANRLTSGGIRLGKAVGFEALQHKGKTLVSLDVFMQIALYNNPIVSKEDVELKKKPLLMRISFEDSLVDNLGLMHTILSENEGVHITKKDLEALSAKEMSNYVLKKLTATGFHIKMMRVDPSQWTYAHIFNKVIELEAQGYKLHVLMIDYLLMMPTTGCIQSGGLGADKRDLVRRVRNFCSARNIAFITPFQLSTEANQLLRNGVPDHQFVNEIAEKNYTDGCKTVGQELDLEFYIHSFTHKRKKYLAFRRGKHRGVPDIPADDKFCMYRFPQLNVPVLHDINGEDTSFSKLPKDYDDGSGSGGGGLLDEILS